MGTKIRFKNQRFMGALFLHLLWLVFWLWFGEIMFAVVSKGFFGIFFWLPVCVVLLTLLLLFKGHRLGWVLSMIMASFPVTFVLYTVAQILPLSMAGVYPLGDLWNEPFVILFCFSLTGLMQMIYFGLKGNRTHLGLGVWEARIIILVIFATYFAVLSMTF